MAVVTIANYNSSHSGSRAEWRDTQWGRQCPNLRSMFPGLMESFKISTTESRRRRRRIAFTVSIAMRSIMAIIFPFWFTTSIWDIPITLLNILFFFATWWNLHLIAEMQGSRMVLSKLFKPVHFDWFLYGMAVVHVSTVVSGSLDHLFGFHALGQLRIGDATIVLAILLVAWISTWEPEEGTVSLA